MSPRWVTDPRANRPNYRPDTFGRPGWRYRSGRPGTRSFRAWSVRLAQPGMWTRPVDGPRCGGHVYHSKTGGHDEESASMDRSIASRLRGAGSGSTDVGISPAIQSMKELSERDPQTTASPRLNAHGRPRASGGSRTRPTFFGPRNAKCTVSAEPPPPT